MEFNTKYSRPKKIPEKNSGERRVETAGYISAQKRIENMIQAGQRLKDYRSEQFDFVNEEPDESYDDPTRKKNFDMAEAFQYNESIKARQKSNVKPSQTAQEPLEKVLNSQTDKKVDE